MAYAATITYQTFNVGKDHYCDVTISETEAGTATETSFSIGDVEGLALVRARSELTSGSGATVDPVLGVATDPADGVNVVVQNGTAAAYVDNVPQYPIPIPSVTLYHRAVCDTGSDNAVSTVYTFKIG